MSDDDFHQPPRQTATTMFRQNEYVSHPSEGRIVSNDPGEANLLVALVDSKRQRVFDRTLHHIARATFSPVRLIANEVVNQIEIETRTIRADRVLAALPDLWLPLPLGEGWGEGFS